MCEPNYTCWVTGAPSEKQVADLKGESTEDDRQSNTFIDDAEFNLMCQDCSWSHHQENPLIVCVCVWVWLCMFVCFNEFDYAKICHFVIARDILGACV